MPYRRYIRGNCVHSSRAFVSLAEWGEPYYIRAVRYRYCACILFAQIKEAEKKQESSSPRQRNTNGQLR